MKINEHLVKVSAGKIAIQEELKLGEDVRLVVEGTVVKSEDTDNQDGTIDRTYVVKGVVIYER